MYAKIEDNQVTKYPYSFLQLRKDNPNTSFPEEVSDEQLTAFGIYKVIPVEPPVYDAKTQRAEELTPVFLQENNLCKQRWEVKQLSEDEIKIIFEKQATSIRAQRNEMISECDWTQLADTALTPLQKTSWIEYRQSLRDIPQQSGFPWEVVWPTKPE